MSTKTLRQQPAYSYVSVPSHSPSPNSFIEIKLKTRLQIVAKRMFDFFAALIGLLCISPFLGVITLLVYLTSPGPIFYKSLRIGKDYQSFYMYKFRTMIPNADQLRSKLYTEGQLEGQLFKLKQDPRITSIGAFLRKYSLDEFPQLLNVIKGEMSLVGPRPYIPEESQMFEPPYTQRFKVMPGMTGPWQVSGRSNLSFLELCELELNYIQNWSILTDFVLLIKTVPSVILKKGAY